MYTCICNSHIFVFKAFAPRQKKDSFFFINRSALELKRGAMKFFVRWFDVSAIFILLNCVNADEYSFIEFKRISELLAKMEKKCEEKTGHLNSMKKEMEYSRNVENDENFKSLLNYSLKTDQDCNAYITAKNTEMLEILTGDKG